ncbi:LpqB family beta-propeller domain-containing protein [Phytohabitans sp. ZYX-F-186]|uniref:LpqB family beta-propeller domain-containing protein n=1 Tax=Phytohabitans maris TaxID=3071409 RepID=A0ABU0ZL47_9ACTN|nr:LpqB family beta-propeller domain-containing protein [Phytohabitans sp. ZYX-F-186]MDQ7907773.1 LpqB family beta-propeller domain-containing protein [Phytohabitans sp. ZYX-F-186]
MRRRTVLAAAAAALAVGLTGCGIPDETQVRDIGPGPKSGKPTSRGGGAGPPSREAATTKESFTTNFLAAGAGEPDKMELRIKGFVREDAREDYTMGREAKVNLARLRKPPVYTDLGKETWKVSLDVDHVGVLDAEGSVGPAELKGSSVEFTISGTEGDNNWYVTDPPESMLLSTDALAQFYTPHTIYFWSADRKTLVPDARYLPSELDKGRQPTQIVEWLTKGPPDWLEPAVSPLNDNAKSNQNVPYPKDRLEVAFNAAAAEPPPGIDNVDMVLQLGQQLMWSLRSFVQVDLQLSLDGERARTFTKDQAFYSANAANRAPEGPEEEDAQPERFALVGGKIYRLKGSPDGGTQPLPRLLLADGVNEGILSAALAREATDEALRTAAALVTQKDGKFQLRLVAAVGDGTEAPVTSGGFTSMGRAVWLKAPMDVGLVVANKQLYQFTPQGRLDRVPLPAGIDGNVADVSAAPDGRRIAVLAKGQVYVLGIARGVKVEVEDGSYRQVPTPLKSASAVDWSEETKVVVAGTSHDDKPAVWEVSIDGALAEQQQVGDPGGTVRHLVAYPDDPVVSGFTTKVMYSREGAAFDLDGVNPTIEAGEVMGAPDGVTPAQVTAPFFLLD